MSVNTEQISPIGACSGSAIFDDLGELNSLATISINGRFVR